jgi:hypothetical protein
MKCANTENGTFEIIERNKRGLEIFLQVIYKDKKLAMVSLFNSHQGREGGSIFDFTKTVITAYDREMGKGFADVMDLLRKKVCLVLQ